MEVSPLSECCAHPEPTSPRLATVFRDHAQFVARSLRRLGVADPQLDDLVQDVFLVVHRRLHEFDPAFAMRSWLYGIARGVAANYRRTRDRTQRRLELVHAAVEHERGRPGVEHWEAAHVVEAFLRGLSETNREVFVLSEIEGMTGPEIARALQIKLNTVYARVRRTRRSFERVIEAESHEGSGR